MKASTSYDTRQAMTDRKTTYTTGVTVLLTALFALAALAASASAATVIAPPGEGAGQVKEPQGLAVNRETGRLYVADQANNRVDVFDSSGSFVKAFGWGVKNGLEEFQTCTTTCREGLAGEGSGQFGRPAEGGERGIPSPTAVAVDNSGIVGQQGDVYAVDAANQRVEKFDEEGQFILTFGGGVDKKTGGDVCTKASGDPCGAGSDGFEEGEFAAENIGSGRTEVLVGVGPSGTVYVVDSHIVAKGTVFLEHKYRLQRFEPSGIELASQHVLFEAAAAGSLAVDSTGDFYVIGDAGEEVIRKYEADGTPIGGVFANEGGGVLAVGAGDRLFIFSAFEEGASKEAGLSIAEYDSTGTPLRRFGYGSFEGLVVGGVAPDKAGLGVYASENSFSEGIGKRVLHLDFPADNRPVVVGACKVAKGTLGNVKATLTALVNPEARVTTYHFEYVTQKQFEASGFAGAVKTPETPFNDEKPVLHDASAELEELTPETKYHCRVIASNTEGTVEGEEGLFTTLEPLEIGSTWASNVGIEAATLNATVNPLGILTTAYFEYVEEATYLKDIAELGPGHAFGHATKAPEVPIDLGAGESFKLASTAIGGLSPGTSYRYRIVATDVRIEAEGKVVLGPVKALRTYRSGEGGLPDNRAYELVSPGQKNSAEVGRPEALPASGASTFPNYRQIRAAAASGDAMTFTSWTSFADPEASPGTSQYLARRGEAGWGTENISPVGGSAVKPPYRGFTPDLGLAAFETNQPKENGGLLHNLYLRDNQSGAAQRLTEEEPIISFSQSEDNFCLDYAGASTDGSRAIFAANGSYAGAPQGKGFSLYEWSAGEGLKPLSILPGKATAVAPTANTTFGAEGGSGAGHCQSGETISQNVVSADGGRVFWTYAPEPSEAEKKEGKEPASQLLVRIGGAETVRIDKGPGGGVFQGANTDGSKAFLTDAEKLKANSGQGDLYLYELPAKELVDLTPAELTPGSEAAGVKGLIGASDDGSYAYFVASGVLSGEEEGAAGERAEAGKDNLYSWHEGEGLRFIAVLSGEDAADWDSNPHLKSARVSADGQSLAFLSEESEALAGYDNTIDSGEHCLLLLGAEAAQERSPLCPQAFLYDANSGELTCASCNPSGARPLGPSNLPVWSNPYEGPRYLSADGQRLFFESLDTLSLADENEKRDVYEFEREGAGSCTSESPSFDPASGGCHFLLSGGKSEDDSYLLDASSSGRDVFLSTRKPLTGSDKDQNFDIYDAREGGGFPEAPDVPICEGEGCKPAVTPPPPPTSSPGTAGFQGPGNPVVKHKKKVKKNKRHRHQAKKPKARHRGRAVR